MILIEDLGMLYPNNNSKNKQHYAIYKCGKCGTEEKRIISCVHEDTLCAACMLENRELQKHNKLNFLIGSVKPHGMSNNNSYNRWREIIFRCLDTKHKAYANYGGRGITVSKEFYDITVFIKYIESLPNYGLKDYSIDRIDNDKGYEKGNLRWASIGIQQRNRRLIQKNNTSGYRGVTIDKQKSYLRYRARTKVNKTDKSLGTYNTAIEAAKAYDNYIIDNNIDAAINGV